MLLASMALGAFLSTSSLELEIKESLTDAGYEVRSVQCDQRGQCTANLPNHTVELHCDQQQGCVVINTERTII